MPCSLGIILALASNFLFTTNNFLMRRYQVNVSDAVLVKCLLQMVFLTGYLYKKGEPILPESRGPRVLTMLQGRVLMTDKILEILLSPQVLAEQSVSSCVLPVCGLFRWSRLSPSSISVLWSPCA